MTAAVSLEAFFRDYAAASFASEPERIAEFYAGSFIAAGPAGSAVFKNDDRFIEWLSQLRQFNQHSGMTAMEVVSVEQVKALSERHLLSSVEWGARFKKTGEQLIKFRISYLVERVEETWKILVYVSEKDQEEEMRRLGLL